MQFFENLTCFVYSMLTLYFYNHLEKQESTKNMYKAIEHRMH